MWEPTSTAEQNKQRRNTGMLHCVQDDGKNMQRQKQIPPLRCGMTNKEQATAKGTGEGALLAW
jgi:hypothetical protein